MVDLYFGKYIMICMHKKVVEFLMEAPPLDEIGGEVVHIIEQYRAGIIKKQVCINRILLECCSYVQTYIDNAGNIQTQMQ